MLKELMKQVKQK